MPIYEYECQKCGDILEVNQKMTDPPLKRHNGASECGGKLVKLMSMNSFHLKGTGWYKTDYAGKTTDGKNKAKSGSGAEKKPEKSAKEG